MTSSSTPTELFGLLNVDKPAGVSSRKIVNDVQRLIRPVRIGHAGTLDPLATGVLILCLGRATRLVPYLQQQPKEYVATFLLGRHSETDDVEQEVIELPDPHVPTPQEVEAALPQFTGEIQQRPPAFSAVKVGGRRAYKMARQGKQVELAARPVTVYEIVLIQYDYPRMVLSMRCGSGTYVRSVGRDLAAALGTACVMSALRRTAIGDFRVEQACRADTLSSELVGSQLLPAARAVQQLPSVMVDESEIHRLRTGQRITRPDCGLSGDIAAVAADGRLISILTVDGDQLRPLRNFV
ncbi:MAG TPA: tRNA pseudouridine(55) synthase TruB [Pirellulaceae bacterium]|jgi:tRNA pseudouridine55 synthase|nr:tRNA pseudouridine(55) synthase TruB [Pirellulaceae bacterium]